MMVVGPKDEAENSVSVRDRISESDTGGTDLGMMPVEEALAKLKEEVESLTVRQAVKSNFRSFDSDTGEQNEY